jgi:hypothetical protein
VKENLKIDIKSIQDGIEAQTLLFSLGYKWAYDDKPVIFSEFTIGQMNTCQISKTLTRGESDRILKEITLPELRELARPKEYLNDKFELVVTNQPDDGWILVPDGAEYFTTNDFSDEGVIFWKGREHFNQYKSWDIGGNSVNQFLKKFKHEKILWQRENKVETVKGRFLHQWAYEAFGRGEDVQHTPCERDCDWTSTSIANPISIFSVREMKFRLKPKTIAIGSRTINKPISVKPEIGQVFYVSSVASLGKFLSDTWNNSDNQNEMFDRNLCHLTAVDAIAMTDALLELMK